MDQFYQELIVDDSICYLDAKSLENEVHWKFHWEQQRKSPAAYCAIMPEGRIFGSSGIVITPDNKLLWEISMEYGKNPQEHSIFSYGTLPPIVYAAQTIGVITFSQSNNYYHWMFDVLARVALLHAADISIDRLVVNCNHSCPFQEELLSILGICSEDKLECHPYFHLQAQNIVIPSLVGYSGHMPKWACDFLKKNISNYVANNTTHCIFDGYERIYISRAKSGTRNVRNEDEVRHVLQRYGFKNVILESLTVAEQVKLFSLANVIIAPHGAGLTNLLFSKPGTTIIEIFSPNYVNCVYWVLSSHIGLNYYYLIGAGERPLIYVDPHMVYDDIRVDICRLEDTIKLAGL